MNSQKRAYFWPQKVSLFMQKRVYFSQKKISEKGVLFNVENTDGLHIDTNGGGGGFWTHPQSGD